MGHDLLIAGMMMLVFDQPQPAPRTLPPPPMPRPPMPMPVLRPSPIPDRARPRETPSRFVVCPADPRCRRHRRPTIVVPD